MYAKKISWLKKVLVLMLVMSLALLAVGCTKPAQQQTNNDQKTEDLQATPGGELSTDAENGGLVPEPGATLKLWDADDDGVEEWANEMIAKFTEKYGIEVTFRYRFPYRCPGKTADRRPCKTRC